MNNQYFNSIKVQLELLVALVFLLALAFQFHKGTIRTSDRLSRSVITCAHFNSIKVQLEQNKIENINLHDLDFNSIKVQLERFEVRSIHNNPFISIP